MKTMLSIVLVRIYKKKILKKINKSFNNLKIKNPRLESFLTASTKGLINNKSNYDKFIKSATGLE